MPILSTGTIHYLALSRVNIVHVIKAPFLTLPVRMPFINHSIPGLVQAAAFLCYHQTPMNIRVSDALCTVKAWN